MHALCTQPDAMINDSSFWVCVESRRCLTEIICIICLKRSGNQCNCAPSLTRTRTPSGRHAEPLCNDRLLHASHCIACGPDSWLDVGNAFPSVRSNAAMAMKTSFLQPHRPAHSVRVRAWVRACVRLQQRAWEGSERHLLYAVNAPTRLTPSV